MNWTNRMYLAFILCMIGLKLTAQTPHPSHGSIKHIERFASKLVQPMNIDIWLPDGYTSTKKYAVIYMPDGQMLFDSTLTWNHQEWGVDETVTKLLSEKKLKDCIVVGIWNDPVRRHAQYMPQRAFELLTRPEQEKMLMEVREGTGSPIFAEPPFSDKYLKFIVHELKPFIDSNYSVLPDPKNTCIMGSSMGALFSLYAICEYPEVFGAVACLSTHWTGIFRTERNPIPDAMLRYLGEALPSSLNHRIYFDYGTAGIDAMYEKTQSTVDLIMGIKGYGASNWLTRKFNGDDHTEFYWRKRLPIPLQFLLKKAN